MNKQDEIENLKKILAEKEALLKARDETIEALNARIKQLVADLYGKKSEKIKPPEEPPCF